MTKFEKREIARDKIITHLMWFSIGFFMCFCNNVSFKIQIINLYKLNDLTSLLPILHKTEQGKFP